MPITPGLWPTSQKYTLGARHGQPELRVRSDTRRGGGERWATTPADRPYGRGIDRSRRVRGRGHHGASCDDDDDAQVIGLWLGRFESPRTLRAYEQDAGLLGDV